MTSTASASPRSNTSSPSPTRTLRHNINIVNVVRNDVDVVTSSRDDRYTNDDIAATESYSQFRQGNDHISCLAARQPQHYEDEQP